MRGRRCGLSSQRGVFFGGGPAVALNPLKGAFLVCALASAASRVIYIQVAPESGVPHEGRIDKNPSMKDAELWVFGPVNEGTPMA